MLKYEDISIPPVKSAKIFDTWRRDEDLSLASIRKTVNYTYDVIYNVFEGKNKDTSLERASRIALALGHDLEEFCFLAFDGNEELLQLLIPSRKKAKELEKVLSELPDKNSSIQQKVEQIMVEDENQEKTIKTAHDYAHQHSEEFEIQIFDRFTKMREEYEHKMEDEFKLQYNEMKAMYERIIAKQEQIIDAQAKKITKLAGALGSESI